MCQGVRRWGPRGSEGQPTDNDCYGQQKGSYDARLWLTATQVCHMSLSAGAVPALARSSVLFKTC